MTRNSKLALTAMVFAGAMAAGTAHARSNVDVQWSVTLGSPGTLLGLPLPPVPVIAVQSRPVVYPAYGYGDRDHDGIPNRYDRVYNPRWGDRDHDGVPNRYDRRDNRRGDRDHDGVPNGRDRHDGRRGHDRR